VAEEIAMTHQLPPDLLERVAAQIATGAYADPDAVLRDAMDGLERRQRSLETLQSMVREAEDDIAAGRVGYFDVQATMQAVEQRQSARTTRQ
jgi:Arc/MetJ-type ribon-helix-helix transcriptional regulator